MMVNEKKLMGVLLFVLLCAMLERTGIIDGIRKIGGEWDRRIVYQKIMSSCEDFRKSETAYSKVYYLDEDKEMVPLVQRTVDLYLPLLEKDFGIANRSRAIVVLYPDEELFWKNIGGRIDRLPMGAYYGGVLNIASPRLWAGEEAETAERFITGGPIVHELSHFLTDLKTEGRVETWLTEGTALYYEYKYTGYEWRPDLAEQSREITVTELRRRFRMLEEGAAYRRAFDIVFGIVQSRGEEGLQAVFEHIAEGRRLSVDRATGRNAM